MRIYDIAIEGIARKSEADAGEAAFVARAEGG